MIEFIQQYLTGEEWEKLCNSCYRMRYQEDGYQEIPASYRGDGGIEGFTKNGIVYQCYCPEKEYTDDDLYNHMRNKMTKDISKFISSDYEKVLKGLGVRNVHRWQFVVPEYKDKRILEHAENKRQEVIEETINHLSAQKDMFEYALNYEKNKKQELGEVLERIRTAQMQLYRLAKSLRRDLYSIDEDLSETIIYKRMSIEHNIQELEDFKQKIVVMAEKFRELSNKWKELLTEKAQLPEKGFKEEDKNKIAKLKSHFISNLEKYEYTSISNVNAIDISDDNYLPVIDKFDMKFDSSASDNIRAIWAYTMALLQTSNECAGNHSGVLIFDEPAQHSIGAHDTKVFFDSILKLSDRCQVIIGITINNADIRKVISEIEDDKCNLINIGEKAFV